MKNFKLFAEGKLIDIRQVPLDEFKVFLDKVEEDGLNNIIDIKQLARFSNNSNRAISDLLRQRLKHITLKRPAGYGNSTIYLYHKPALLSLCYNLNISQSKHVQDERLFMAENIVLATPEMAKQVATEVLAQQPNLFKGKLTGINSVPRLQVSNINIDYFIIESFISVLPHASMAKGYAFHADGIIAVMRQLCDTIKKQYNIPSAYMPASMFLARI